MSYSTTRLDKWTNWTFSSPVSSEEQMDKKYIFPMMCKIYLKHKYKTFPILTCFKHKFNVVSISFANRSIKR